MKVCVFGCGAMGSLLAARLARGSAAVSAVARGPQLEALRASGITVVDAHGASEGLVRVEATAEPKELGLQDIVIVTLKSHMLAAAVTQMAPLLGPDTVVVTASNGLPWWYFYAAPGSAARQANCLQAADPGGIIWKTLDPRRAVGAVMYPAAQLVKPGTVQHLFGDRLTLGEPSGQASERLQLLAGLLNAAGFDAPVQADIRTELWTKLMANAAYNPVSVLTGKTLGAMLDDPATTQLLVDIMNEVAVVAHAVDVALPVSPQHMLAATRQLGPHKTSMLQDYEAGRTLELEPLVGAICELAEREGVAATQLNDVYAQVRAMSA